MPARSRVAGVVLAAGLSTRHPSPQPKQLLDWEGEPLVRRVARRVIAAGLQPVAVVVGHHAERVREALAGLDVEIVDNPAYRQGQSSSVRAGLEAIAARSDAALFVPADLPHLTVELIERLLASFEEGGGPIVLPAHRGRRGAPVLFAARLFGELAAIEGDQGGRQLFPAHEGEIVEVEIDSPRPLVDID